MNEFQFLKKLVFNGASIKKLNLSDSILDRLNFELNVIENKGYCDYFIMYSKLVEVCNNLNLLRSPGRGTSLASLVNFCLDITNINPIDNQLIFERFIESDRTSLPDIDIDIPAGSFKKILSNFKEQNPEYFIYKIAFLSKQKANRGIQAISCNGETYNIHETGILILKSRLTVNILNVDEEEVYLTKNLYSNPLYEQKVDLVEQQYLQRLQMLVNNLPISKIPASIPLDDKKTYQNLSEGNNSNIFQLDAQFLKTYLENYKPGTISDLAALFAMYRPGLFEYLPILLRNKSNEIEKVKWSDERLNIILKETFGLPIYQESFIIILNEIADIKIEVATKWMKKLISNRTTLIEDEFKDYFKNECSLNCFLHDYEVEALCNLLLTFSKLLFQKSHSLSYATVAYWSAYYKTHYPSEFQDVFLNYGK